MLDFEYTVKVNARSKRVRIAIHADGSCVVTVPRRLPQAALLKVLAEKSAWITATLAKLKAEPRPYSFKGTAAELKKYKSSALRLVNARLEYFNRLYGFVWTGVSIRNQQSRWGSCSSAGKLNFSYKLCLLPPELADYIIVHELCHLGEMNHSPRFWALVARAIPEYRKLKSILNYGQASK